LSKKDKLIARLKSKPLDFTFDELVALMASLGFTLSNKGKTSGSRVSFIKNGYKITIHRPHRQKTLLGYQVLMLLKDLEAFI